MPIRRGNLQKAESAISLPAGRQGIGLVFLLLLSEAEGFHQGKK